MALAAERCVRYDESESAAVTRWRRTTLFGAPDGDTGPPRCSARNPASLVVTADAEPRVLQWSDGTMRLASAPTATETPPTWLGGTDPAVVFIDASCPLRDGAPRYPTDGTAGAICFSTREEPWFAAPDARSARLRFAWGGGDAAVELDTDGAVLRLRVAGSTVALPGAQWMTDRIARYTLAWRVADGGMALRLWRGPTDSRTVLHASGSYAVGAAAAFPPGGAALSGRWVHVYALQRWAPAIPVDRWEAAVAALDAEWRWRPSACSVTFDARHRDALTLPWPPASALSVGAWRAEPPNATAWRLLVVPNAVTMAAPTYVAGPRPGLRFGTFHSHTDVHGLVGGHDSAGLVAFTSIPLAERPDHPEVSVDVTMIWQNAGDGSWSMLVLSLRGFGDFYASYNSGSGRDWLFFEQFDPDESGGRPYAMGWTVKDRTVQMWVVCGSIGGRTTVTRQITFAGQPGDNAPEPEVAYSVEYYGLTLHELRLVSPSPSPTDWAAAIHAADAAWCAL